MCNLYSHTRNVDAMRQLFRRPFQSHGINLPAMPGIFPDYPAPIIRKMAGASEPELAMVRWGMPSSKQAIYQSATKRVNVGEKVKKKAAAPKKMAEKKAAAPKKKAAAPKKTAAKKR